MGSCDPLQVISLVECGIDMFDASYALHLTKRNAAIDADVLFNSDIENIDLESEQDVHHFKGELPVSFELDLSDPRYKEDFNPISANCSCYTCQNHTRAYVNHLIATKELLAPVLLTIHNTFSYSRFFYLVGESVGRNRLASLKNALVQTAGGAVKKRRKNV